MFGAHRVERLGQVQPLRRAPLLAHGDDERVGRGLQDGQPGGEHEQGDQEELVDQQPGWPG
jgi:hypothetical protein